MQNFISSETFDPNTIFTSYDSAGGKIKQSMYSHLNTLWTESRLNVIFGLINEIMESGTNEISTNLVNALSSYMNCIDMFAYAVITNLN